MRSTFSVSEEEKMRILEMHSPKRTIVEQVLMPSVPDIKRGETINLYDETNKLDKRFMISKVVQDLNGVVRIDVKSSQTSLGGKSQKQEVKVSYKCKDEHLETDIEKENVQEQKDEVAPEVIKYKSDSFVNRLRKKFCMKNSKGEWVPKADFASTNVEPSDMV